MPVHNFMLDDVLGSLKAIGLFPLFLFLPGFAVAWLLDLFEFRLRTAAFRVALAIPLSLGICPIITFLIGRFFSWNAVWMFYASIALFCLGVGFVRWRGRTPQPLIRKDLRVFVFIAFGWLAMTLFSLVDLQIGDRLYYPASAYDNSVHAEFVHSITATGIPPQNPFYLAGPPASLRYHYFWMMMCSLVERAGHGDVSPRQALIGGTFWCGLGLMALVALYLRLFMAGDPARFRRRALTGMLLLGITGLDILPVLLMIGLYAKGAVGFVLPSVELWNELVAWFVYSIFGSTHGIHSLIACFIGFLLLWKAPAAIGWRGALRYVVPASLALASSIGASVYVSFVFATFLAVWTVITVCKKWFRETAILAAAGITCVGLIAPYLSTLSSGPGAAAGLPFRLTVRAFVFANLMPGWSAMTPGWRLILANGPMIPLNYLLEFGVFFLTGFITLRKLRKRGFLTREELASVAMVATSILICTFLRSSVIENNDLGYRGLLVAQFILLLWAADVLADSSLLVKQKRLLVLFLFIGAAGSVYDLAINRFFAVLSDAGVVPPLHWMSPDRQLGKRTYASRYAYEWAQSAMPSGALQFNPEVFIQDTDALLYSQRRFVAGDKQCNTAFGGDPKLCAPLVTRLLEFYSAAPKPDAMSIADVCQSVPATMLVAKDTDPAWTDSKSWVWTKQPVFSNPYVRLYGCHNNSLGGIAER